MTADPSPSSVTRERPLRLASSIGRGTCVIYWLALTFGLLRPHGGDAKDFASAFGLGEHPDLAHFLAFVLLALVCQAARWPWNWRLAVTTLVVYAVATELAQAWIPGRTADLLDGLANLLGLAVGMAVWRAGSGVANALSPRS